MSLKINICGDLVPTSLNEKFFIDGDIDTLVGEDIKNILLQSDLNIVNLECPLTNNGTKISKNGPNLKGNPKSIDGIKAMNFDVCSLANNHILDYGEEGLIDTIALLTKNGIDYLGVGANINELKKHLIIQRNGISIGIYSCAEHEFSIAKSDSWGANGVDLISLTTDIKELKAKCDYLIVLLHGGKELYQYPTPKMQKTCRFIASLGADLIVCQHSHCIGAEENYNGSKIIYGQGNFLFASKADKGLLNESLIIQVELNKGSDPIVKYLPIIRVGYGCRLASDEVSTTILSAFKSRSSICLDEKALLDNYNKFALSMIDGYLLSLSGITKKNYIFRILNKISGGGFSKLYLKKKYKDTSLLAMLNSFECEPHNELIIAALKAKLNFIDNKNKK